MKRPKLIPDDKPMKPAMAELDVDQTIAFPARRASSVRSAASDLSFELGRKYITRRNRIDSTVEVTRIA